MTKFTRILLFGDYITQYPQKLKYELQRQDNETYLVIEEDKPFIAGNMNRPFIPRAIDHKNKIDKLLLCEQFDDDGNVLNSFLLLPHKLGWWALTPNAAKNGVFHHYKRPFNFLEQEIINQGLSKRLIHEVPYIFYSVRYGKVTDTKTSKCVSDSTTLLPQNDDPINIIVKGGTYLIHYYINATKSNRYIVGVYYTDDADLDKVASAVRRIREE